MTPEEIEAAEFFVGMRGYEKSEVRDFLQVVAAEQRTLLGRVADLEAGRPAGDPIDELGRQVTAIVRTAQEAARAMLVEAEQAAADLRAGAEREARRIEDDAAAIRRDADAQHGEADRHLTDARREAERILADATRRGEDEAAAIIARAEARRQQVDAACDEMVTRLYDAVTGAQMSLLVLRPDEEEEAAEAEAAAPSDAPAAEPIDLRDEGSAPEAPVPDHEGEHAASER